MPHVRTVLGDIDPAKLGFTHTHEHLLCDLNLPMAPETTMRERATREDAISLENYYFQRRHHTARRDLALDSEEDAIEAMVEYRAAGGDAIVEATPLGLGRDAQGLQRIARATGVNIVMGSAFYCRPYHPIWVEEMSADELTDHIVRDVVQGVGETAIKAGVIGEVGLTWPHHQEEERVLKAAARAQQITGAPLLIHPGRHTRSPFDAIAIVKAEGGDIGRTIMSHIDRTLFDTASIKELAATGCFVEFDLFGQESSYYSMAPIDMPNDATRVDHIRDLLDGGFGTQVLIAQDICHKTHMRKYGGEGYTHILENVLPLMRRKGFGADEIAMLTVENPQRALICNSRS